ncbi:MAG TPA: MFS transporter [Acidimicrobiales bacterium]|nr:MFS transporter [Acidimicrobiales bacterium]
MDAPAGWRTLRPSRPAAITAPFARLARTHALSTAGDTLVATALAGSLFFSISPDAARTQVALYLVLTMAPFAVVAPLVGPWIDRRAGGRRTMVVLSAAVRAVVCLLMIDDVGGLLLFPEALTVLVAAKGYQVARASLVPGLVRDESQLVEANSKLTLISGIVGFVAAAPGVALLQLGPEWVLAAAVAVFVVTTLSAYRIPRTRVAVGRADPQERAELRGAGILLAASAMAVLRTVVGFLSFLVAFSLRADGAPAWWFGVVLGAGAVGSLVGALAAPPLRSRVPEERILLGCLVFSAMGALGAVWQGGRLSAATLAAVVGLAATGAKLCFDSIVQRDAPDANQGASFARFEARFQLVWVAGAFLPVVLPIPLTLGELLVAALCLLAAFLYATGRRISTARLTATVAAGKALAAQRLAERSRPEAP